ncbi:hypothetical protein BGP84_15990 [Pseudomonas putida]|jgi:hypothetical protein|uniref:Uncharacterized protein n=1 Tax=Pseudomonas putida TaxID=303 RepID=A0A2S3X7S5_PSEPU|nr:hypothetical protein [Pseudomonas putida]POG11158.1 hypothetical protein BGP84_15990 [Pseudomonas putida]POG14928.1 hypothetical protein BGP85_01735 [Pseudomonas putida]
MSTISDIIKNENPVDVVLFLTSKSGIDHPRLDRLYNQNNWANIGDNMKLIELIRDMKSKGLIQNQDGRYVRGPNWEAPAFLLEKKYTFE